VGPPEAPGSFNLDVPWGS